MPACARCGRESPETGCTACAATHPGAYVAVAPPTIQPQPVAPRNVAALHFDTQDAMVRYHDDDIRLAFAPHHVSTNIERVKHDPVTCSWIVSQLGKELSFALRRINRHQWRNHSGHYAALSFSRWNNFDIGTRMDFPSIAETRNSPIRPASTPGNSID